MAAWNLKDLVRDPKEIPEQMRKLEQAAQRIKKKRNALDTFSREEFFAMLKELEQYSYESSIIGSYAFLWYSEDSSNQRANALKTRIEQKLTKLHNDLLFFSLWFKKLPDDRALVFIKNSGKYEYFLIRLRADKPFTLSEPEEKIINIKDSTAGSALDNLYNILTSQFEYTVDGKPYHLPELQELMRSHEPDVRKKAYDSLLLTYKRHQDALSEIYKATVNDWREEDITLRGHKNPIAVRNHANDIPGKAVDALLNVCRKNERVFWKFFSMKAKKLNMKKLRRYDISAPLTQKRIRMPYELAVKTTLASFGAFSPRFRKAAEQIITSQHVDSAPRRNKYTGAFCHGVVPGAVPYVLLSYKGHPRDVSTVAHELGHGIHDILAKECSVFSYQPALPLAETASIFAELLLFEHLKKTNPKLLEEILYTKIEEFYATIIRQAGFVRFEQAAHEMIKIGATTKELCTAYLKQLKEQFGNSVVVDDNFQYEWLYIPHIYHTPFYCYAYAFGNLLVLALYKQYLKDKKGFPEKLIRFLSYGGSKAPIEVTKEIGVDICAEQFWQSGFDMIKEMIEELETF
ncbi:M3 family oligoendopeptidase [Candidatus Woesearchaeota archaeon]|nr:M3 family oligoendopeptidase [Candidatus Woesearchaeota archaeon]